MICLFFDTSLDLLKVTLLKDNEVIYDKQMITKNDHSSYLVPSINEAFKKNNIDFKNLDKIIVGIGPGSFTGTRISITIAKTYASSFNIPVIPISSLEQMIYSVYDYDYYVSIIEEKNDNMYIAIFDKDRKRVLDDSYINMEKLYSILNDLNGKVAIISNSNKRYDNYDCFEKKINPLEISNNININNHEVNPHLLKPNYIKKIEAEAKL
ncbi:MAG: tRNA (adenosine(37)-N6)-threonylcarbamoyltransferase complex dimerization subunit type 1 TsaB [Bacilli bacterium]|nr:tRNA (adenosine(37)-N6)-threonylcarbamoyltransferase complex dimerization subunit type 1 TsaB [Bacilli bacterium]MBP3634897.1 tRNA (adenosine(37)-N6)-threonylcarbamoyltransferase complex dimerization subunit type 1 TsaB [Bacilli bacterium]